MCLRPREASLTNANAHGLGLFQRMQGSFCRIQASFGIDPPTEAYTKCFCVIHSKENDPREDFLAKRKRTWYRPLLENVGLFLQNIGLFWDRSCNRGLNQMRFCDSQRGERCMRNCNRLHQTATDCSTLQQTATDCNRLQQTATKWQQGTFRLSAAAECSGCVHENLLRTVHHRHIHMVQVSFRGCRALCTEYRPLLGQILQQRPTSNVFA